MASDIYIKGQPYRTRVQSPPGAVVAPNGFPTNARPKGAPQSFLDAMDIRIKVFCDEQNCREEEELDSDDPKSWSWIMYQVGSDGLEPPVSTIRIVPPPHPAHPNGFEDPHEQPYLKLTRVATLATARGKGLSKILLEQALQFFASKPHLAGSDWKGLVLTHAQVEVEGMYKKLGFVTDMKLGKWDEEGIAHVGMWRTVVTVS